MRLAFGTLDSPLGPILAAAGAGGLCALEFADHRDRMEAILRRRFGSVRLDVAQECDSLAPVADRIARYFAGDLGALTAIPVDTGGTTFQREVWSMLRRIPPGNTISYQELAASIGRPSAARAAGAANSRNPIAIVIPCHRVIGTRGSLTGYAGGLERKRWLLDHEARSLALADPARAEVSRGIGHQRVHQLA